jgi:hypothetical protein
MYLRLALLVAGTVYLYGQAPVTDAASAFRDSELLRAPLSLNNLTEQRATELEAAAQRQLDRAKAQLEKIRTLVDAGLQPRQTLEAPTEEVSLAQTDYELTLARTKLVHEVSEMALIEQQSVEAPAQLAASPAFGILPVMEKFEGDGSFNSGDFHRVQSAFEQEFHKPLPISAEGETAVHRAMGFDHRNRVDVALLPDTTEGKWLRHFLEVLAIPYYAFRSQVPGKATAAHIHIGPPSTRLSAHSGA